MQAGFRRNDDEAIDTDWQPYSLNPCLHVIPAQAGIQWLIQDIPAWAGMPVFEALINSGQIKSEMP